jgi:hypothetical protein
MSGETHEGDAILHLFLGILGLPRLSTLYFPTISPPSSDLKLKFISWRLDSGVTQISTGGNSRELLLLPLTKMATPEVHHLFHQPIADHSFSADQSLLAVAKDSNVELYAKSGRGFTLKDELTGHDKTITGVDIAPRSGKIVTCSQGWCIGYLEPWSPN